MSKSILQVKNLKKKYENLTAVKGISFEVKKNEIFGILGPNGAGKTTAVEMIEGLRSIDDGSVKIDGINVANSPRKAKEIIGIQLQESDYFDNLNLKEILTLFGAFYNRHIDAIEILKTVELVSKKNSLVKELSGGQKQRLSIALALVNDPKLIFLDEPTTGLDPQARRHMWKFIQNLKDDGKTIILTTHYMEEAELLCDRVAIMDEGEILEINTPNGFIEELLETGFEKEQEIKEANLEDVFLNITGKKLRD